MHSIVPKLTFRSVAGKKFRCNQDEKHPPMTRKQVLEYVHRIVKSSGVPNLIISSFPHQPEHKKKPRVSGKKGDHR